MGKLAVRVTDHLVVAARVSRTPGQERADRLAGIAVPNPIAIKLIIDTGSKRSSLIPGIVDFLKPTRDRDIRVETSTGIAATSLYWVRLDFPDTALMPFPEFEMARLPVPSSLATYHGVIGRDLLFAWEYFLLEGRRRRFTIRDTPGGLFGWLWR